MAHRPRLAFTLRLLLGVVVSGTALNGAVAPASQRPPAPPVERSGRPALTLLEEGPGRLRLAWTLKPGALRLERTDTGARVRAAGYGLRPAGAGVEVPYRVEYVAIPEGVFPRLEIVPGAVVQTMPLGTLTGLRSPGGAAQFPISLGGVGYFRDQRFVEVRVSPVRVSAAGDALELIENLTAVLRWDPAQEVRSEPSPEDPRAERAYRRLFPNYEQARAYRVPRQAAGAKWRSSRRALEPVPVTDGEGGGSEPIASESVILTQSASATELVTPGLRARIRADRDGLVRISQALLAGAAADLAAADPRTLRLTHLGQELPIRIEGELDGSLDAGDFIEFYATRRLEPTTVVRADEGVFSTIYALNDYTDTNVYWLEAGASAPRRVALLDAAPGTGVPLAPHWRSTASLDPPDLFLPFGGNDPWIACPVVQDRSGAGCAGSSCCEFPDHDFTLVLPDYTPVAEDAGVRVRLQGWNVQPHVVDLFVNSVALGSGPLQWSSRFSAEGQYTVSNTVLSATTALSVSVRGNGIGTLDRVVLDSVEVDYRRLFQAVGGALEFVYPDGQDRFEVEGFTSASLLAYELSERDPLSGHPQGRLLGGVQVEPSGGGFRAVFQQNPEGGGERRFLVAAPEAIQPPLGIEQVDSAPVCDPALGADLIVIAHSSLIDLSPGSALERYVAHRSSQGLRVRVVPVEDVYDQFAFGLPEPQAIRDFLACAYETGPGPPPLYVLLLGDGTSDYKNQRNLPDHQNLVTAPVHMIEDTIFSYYSSDESLAAFRGDDFLPDVMIGRISAGTPVEAANALDKIVRYETTPPPGAWRSHGIFVAGDGNDGTGEDRAFVQDSLNAAATFQPPFTSETLFYGESPWDGTQASQFRMLLKDRLSQGAGVVNYVGHGNFTIWDGDLILRNQDVADLTNTDRLPFYISSTCLMAGYHLDTGDSLGELLLHSTPDTGGIGVVSPSGISNFNIDARVNAAMYEALMGPRRESTLGGVVLAGQLELAGTGSFFDLEGLTLLGDPALRLTLPAPAPPSALQAGAGNLRVDLSWQASPDAVAGYHVYRTRSPDPSVEGGALYVRLTQAPLTDLFYADLQVQNTVTYAYTLSAVDADGFEGAYSNLNATCGASAMDCAQATPYNPAPPAPPAGLVAEDPGIGFSIQLSWEPNPEPDVENYTVFFGTEPGTYTSSLEAGLGTSTRVSGLENGVRYYFVITATNSSDGFIPPGAIDPLDNESLPSAEVSAVPSLVEGIRSPAMVRDLRVFPEPDGTSLRLEWTAPLIDIYGNPTTVVGFQVHRGFSVDFEPTQDTLAAPLLAPTETSWVDVDALDDPRDFFYFVLAEDGSGLLSSASRALPTGVGDLEIAEERDPDTGLPTGNVTLSWSTVTHDIEGEPTVVDHYALYGSESPFGRDTLSASILLADDIRTLSLTLPAPAGSFYYFLVAVDRRGNMSPF